MTKERYYDEVRNNYTDGNFTYIDAWEHDKDEGHTVAVVHGTGDVFYIPGYRIDSLVEEAIDEVIDKIKQRQ